MNINFDKFKNSLPYASEMYGIYQPLLGWKSKRMLQRFKPDLLLDNELFRRISASLKAQADAGGIMDLHVDDLNRLDLHCAPLEVRTALPKSPVRLEQGLDNSLLLRALAGRFEQAPDELNPSALKEILSRENLDQMLGELSRLCHDNNAGFNPGPTAMLKAVNEWWRSWQATDPAEDALLATKRAVKEILDRESLVAGVLHELVKKKRYSDIIKMFTAPDENLDWKVFEQMRRLIDPLETFDVKTDLDKVVLSPVGIVHLFRQYFFEFDSFLGPSVQHVWLSPGSQVEMIEINTRRTQVERSSEDSGDTLTRRGSADYVEDELSDAIRQNNNSKTHFGVSVETDSDIVVPFYTGEIQTSTDYNMDNSVQVAKESVHNLLRKECNSVATAVRKSYRTTFRSVTETEDVSSKKYLLANTTPNLINYELRRKMRQVGVQVQDIGAHLCWQTYVDLPGDELRIANLLHISKPENLNLLPNPEAIPMPEPLLKAETIRGSFAWDMEDKPIPDRPDLRMVPFQKHLIVPPKSGYLYERYEIRKVQGNSWILDAEIRGNEAHVGIRSGNPGIKFDERVEFAYELDFYFRPGQSLIDEVNRVNQARLEQAKQENAQRAAEAYFNLAKERINAERAIKPRKFEELREEERIVVYRNLMRQLLKETGFGNATAATQHVLAELVQSMFDVNKMLYFVAPEWWSPRHLGQRQAPVWSNPAAVSAPAIPVRGREHYAITEKSNPAPMGSSLGWLLQLDGDKQRNAFINAPWVKAVIPIRSGKELAALNWLTQNMVEGSEGLDGLYQEGSVGEKEAMLAVLQAFSWDDPVLTTRYQTITPGELQLRDAIRCLALRVQAKFMQSKQAVEQPLNPEDPNDLQMGRYLPTEKVFETGFDPIGGFQAAGPQPFAVFSQWLEVVPTDQIVAVEVKYDPKTGMQV